MDTFTTQTFMTNISHVIEEQEMEARLPGVVTDIFSSSGQVQISILSIFWANLWCLLTENLKMHKIL